MQLDLLQKDQIAAKAGNAPVPTKKIKAPETAPETEEKAPSAFKTISEAATTLDVPQHVLRFWEGRFSQIKPLKLRGGRRYYRPEDMEILSTIKHLLYKQGYTIKGARKAFSLRKPVVLESPAEEKISAPAAKTAAGLNDRQHNQLAVIKQELMVLREMLKPYIA